jgi:hypothetical protein
MDRSGRSSPGSGQEMAAERSSGMGASYSCMAHFVSKDEQWLRLSTSDATLRLKRPILAARKLRATPRQPLAQPGPN